MAKVSSLAKMNAMDAMRAPERSRMTIPTMIHAQLLLIPDLEPEKESSEAEI